MPIPFSKDPNERLDYDLDWTPLMPEEQGEDHLTSSSWEIVGDSSTISIDGQSFTDTWTKVWLTGGTHGEEHEIVNEVQTQLGRIGQQTIRVYVHER